jgi:membrane-associated protease RseP (regulator of RpoE activity)
MSDPLVPTEILDPSPSPYEVHIIHPIRRRYWLHLLLFLATIFTTLVVGARLEYNFASGVPQFRSDTDLCPVLWVLRQPSRILLGIPFCTAFMAILLAHEMGHFVYARRHRVYATLPFFIPIPILFGTMGAFIRIRSPIRSRAALFDIGISGPIAGFVVAVVVLVASMPGSKPIVGTSEPAGIIFHFPLIFRGIWHLIPAHTHLRIDQIRLTPVAIAAWMGMFVTALNLLPGGQLDGGHIVYALFPRAHKLISRATCLVLVPMSYLWTGWLLWAGFLLLTLMQHPPVPGSPTLDKGRRTLGTLALIMFVVTIVPAPFGQAGLLDVISQLKS